MKAEIKDSLRSFLFEFVLYAILVTGYFFAVLNLLPGWLEHLYEHQRRLYSVLSLGLIAGQGVVLEVLTRLLLGWIKPRTEV